MKLGYCLLVFNVLANAACGAIKNDGGSTHGSGGTGGGSTGDDGTPKPPPARGALSLHVDAISPADPLYGNYPCSPGRHWVNFPYERDYPPADQTQHTTDTDAPFVTVSGEAGNRLYCRVAPRGTAFEVTAEITGYAEFEGQKLRPTVLTLSIPAISADQADGLGSIAIQDNEFPSEFSDTGCVFSTQGGTLGVEAGRLWAKVKCDYLMGRSSIGQACRIDTGFVLLENCTQ